MQNRQNKFKIDYFYIPTFFKGHFEGSGATPHMTRKKLFLLKRVQNLYLGKVGERRLFSSFGFLWTHKKVTGGSI